MISYFHTKSKIENSVLYNSIHHKSRFLKLLLFTKRRQRFSQKVQ